MPAILSKSQVIDPSARNYNDGLNIPQNIEKWKIGTFINIYRKKTERAGGQNPFASVFLAQPPATSSNPNPETYFYTKDPITKLLVGGILSDEDDIKTFGMTYPEDNSDFTTLFRFSPEQFSKEEIDRLHTGMNDRFSSFTQDSAFLKSITLNPEINQIALVPNYSTEKLDGAHIKGVFGFLEHAIDGSDTPIQDTLAALDKSYDTKVTSFVASVGAIKSDMAKEKETNTNTMKREPMQKISDNVAKSPLKRLNQKEFQRAVESNIIATNRKCRGFWQGIAPEPGNPMQEKITNYFKRNMWIMLTGDTGIGKTYNPLDLAEKNDIPFVEIKLHQDIEHSDLAGAKELAVDIDSKEMDTMFMTGPFIRGLKNAAEAAKEGKGFLMILDEILRVKDNSLFISGFSESGAGEYGFEYGQGVEFRKIETENEGTVWFKITDFDEESTMPYQMLSDGKIYFNDDAGDYLFDGSENETAERCWREKIPSISKDNYRQAIRENGIKISGRFAANTKVYVPSSALYVIGTTNVGQGYTVGMKADAAFTRRFFPEAAERPSVAFMVKTKLKEEMILRGPEVEKDWAPVLGNIEDILTTFYSAMDKKIASTAKDGEALGQKVNFSMIKDSIRGLDDVDPLKDPIFGILPTLEIAARKFAPVNFSVTTKEMQQHPLVKAAEATIEEIKNGSKMKASKGVNTRKKVENTDSKIVSAMNVNGMPQNTASTPAP